MVFRAFHLLNAVAERHKAKLEAEKQAMRELAESSLEASGARSRFMPFCQCLALVVRFGGVSTATAARLQAARDRLNAAKEAAVQRSKERRDEDETHHAALQARMHTEFNKRSTSK
jgi:hypothetical protein